MAQQTEQPRFRASGDSGLLVEFGDHIDRAINQRVWSCQASLKRERPSWLIDSTATYCSLFISYDPCQVGLAEIKKHVLNLANEMDQQTSVEASVFEIPVCYGGEMGPDLEFVAQHAGLGVENVIKFHSQPQYYVYMMGFSPGFPFLGGLPERLHTPRLETPRTAVHAGSVGIANGQTGIYPLTSPGGWRIIGRTPFKLFDPTREEHFLLKDVRALKFVPISIEEFATMSQEEAS